MVATLATYVMNGFVFGRCLVVLGVLGVFNVVLTFFIFSLAQPVFLSSWYSIGPCVCTFLFFFALQTPNINTNRLDEADDQYHRRLFMYDQVTGVSEVGAAPEIVRYVDYIEIETMIVENDVDKMHVPIISVHYTERTMGAAGLSGPMKTAMLEFKGKQGLCGVHE